MTGLIKSRTNQVVHSRIQDDEAFVPAALDVDHPRDQRTALTHHRAAQLEMQLLSWTEMQRASESAKERIQIGKPIGVGIVVVDAQATTHVDVLYADAVADKLLLQLVDTIAQRLEVAHV